MAKKDEGYQAPEQDTSAYVGVDPMYQNYASETEKPFSGSDQEGIVLDGPMVLEIPSVTAANAPEDDGNDDDEADEGVEYYDENEEPASGDEGDFKE